MGGTVSLTEVRARLLAGIAAKGTPVVYDLGSGPTPEAGFVGVDLKAKGENIVAADLFASPWPFADGSVDYFHSCHFLEHVPDWDQHFVEIYRCLKVGGYYEIRAPYFYNTRWHQDPNHRQPILHQRFLYLNQEWMVKNEIQHDHPPINFDVHEGRWFELLNDDYAIEGEARFDDAALEWAKRHYLNVIDDLAVVLVKLPMDKE